jgi:hypothetical protein
MQLTQPPAGGPRPAPGPSLADRAWRIRLFGLAMIGIGCLGRWYNWHLAETTGQFYIKATLLGPAGVFGGLLLLLRPDWVGPLRRDSSLAHKVSIGAVLALMLIGSGIDLYLLNHLQSARATVTPIRARSFAPVFDAPPAIDFLGRNYRLGSFNQNKNAMWEFVTAQEKVKDWTTLFTVIDRPDTHTREELDRLAEGVMADYKSHGAKILAAKSMQEGSGGGFNYLVAAFEEPGAHRYELNFVKMAMGFPEGVVMIYGVRITDPVDYQAKAKEFLDRNSSEVGSALGKMAPPDIRSLPRQVF